MHHLQPPRDAAVRRLTLVGIGQSHLGCLQAAAESMPEHLVRAGLELRTIVLNDPAFQPAVAPESIEDDVPRLHPVLREAILRACESCDACFLAIGGNAHNFFGLVENPVPYDFVLASDPGRAALPGRALVPGALVLGALLATEPFRLQRALRRAIAPLLPRPVVQLESPPPIGDESHIVRHPGFYRDLVPRHGVAPAALRHKLWRLHADVVAEDCRALGISILEVPRIAVDPQGFLVPEAYADDPTHGNAWYGARVLEQLVAHYGPSRAMTVDA